MNMDVRSVLSDPGGVRDLTGRWTIEGSLLLEGAAHLGGGRGEAADMLILRDGLTGLPLLTGSSIAGALRSHLADVLGGYRSDEDPRVGGLFGGARGDHLGGQSSLIVFDSHGRLPKGHNIEIRDGVQIDECHGTAEDHKKFDLEVLPAGTSFPLRFDLVVSAPDNELELVRLLVTALSGLATGDIALGARRSRGLGAARADRWRAARYDFTSREGWMAWLLSDHVRPLDDTEWVSDPTEACRRAWPGVTPDGVPDLRRRIVADVCLELPHGLLVRSAPVMPDTPDAVHLQSAGRSVLPGASLAGVLRRQAVRIADIIRHDHGDAEAWVTRLFGPRMTGTSSATDLPMHASRFRVAEAFIEEGTRTRPTRVRIDRFTQGVVAGALFEEEIEQGGKARVRIEVRNPQHGELGLILLLLKDLLTGDIPVGGTSAVGRGRLKGTATLQLEDERKVSLDPQRPADSGVDAAIREFWNSSALGGGR